MEETIRQFRDHPSDAWYTLDRPGGGSISFTKAGHDRFAQIVNRRIRQMEDNGLRFKSESVVKALQKEYLARVFNGSLEATAADVLFKSALAAVEATHEEETHFIPCAIIAHTAPSSFSMGPVTFSRREEFWKTNEPRIRTALPQDREFGEILFSRLRDFFASCWWVASVAVPRCDTDISAVRATKIVQKCLDLLKLTIGSDRGANIHQGYDSAIPGSSGSLREISDTMHISVGGKMHDAVLSDDWFSGLSSEPSWVTADSAIQAYWLNWDRSPDEIQQRFMDGMAWHSDAVSERDVTAQIVKYWTAIERIVSLRNRDEVTRGAAMLLSDSSAEFEANFRNTQTLYTRRSDILHGSVRRGDVTLTTCSRECEKLSRAVLFKYLLLVRTSPMGLEAKQAKKFLGEVFARLDADSKRILKQSRAS